MASKKQVLQNQEYLSPYRVSRLQIEKAFVKISHNGAVDLNRCAAWIRYEVLRVKVAKTLRIEDKHQKFIMKAFVRFIHTSDIDLARYSAFSRNDNYRDKSVSKYTCEYIDKP